MQSHQPRNDRLEMFKTTALIVIVFVASAHPTLRQRAGFSVMEATVDDIRAALGSGQVTCQTVVRDYLARIEAYDKSGPALNAVQTINRRALQDAERLDSIFRTSGPVGPLHCVPVLLKDRFETSEMPTSYGSDRYCSRNSFPSATRRS
jgi:Asp-tRNA(Asn)/Glu-tRNA(Gln) amidotransferase A subunit family amidase